MNILHLDSSIQGETSVSRALSAAVVEQLRAAHPGAAVGYRDLAAAPLPHLDLAGLATAAENPVLRQFLDSDIVVIGLPMYNFGVPSQLKSWIDHVVVAGHTFRYGAEGPEGLARGKRVIVAQSRGGVYSEGPAAAAEHAESYLRAVFGLIGIAEPEFVTAEGVAFGPEAREAAMSAAFARIEPIGAGRVVAA
ncbi:FMN-dependent NADH-azoreductase [Sphingomonas sp.]|uniref:FMN-dependent NADH-azoreductase n=1 Tax=Sphingomonas sp. TaxID=28214 RepID=UPI001B27A9AD|nr:FMN-dependent NADH-azoreductase [Sphingomonas sp.]MBO9713823.1 FMN-dependent NADH-azoreductase [Sphingomonas sp.]